jgi:hypothetical protein
MCAGHVKVMATDEWAHVVLMAALEHTDDTALLRKTLLPELLVLLSSLWLSGKGQVEFQGWLSVQGGPVGL